MFLSELFVILYDFKGINLWPWITEDNKLGVCCTPWSLLQKETSVSLSVEFTLNLTNALSCFASCKLPPSLGAISLLAISRVNPCCLSQLEFVTLCINVLEGRTNNAKQNDQILIADLISYTLKKLNSRKKQGWLYSQEYIIYSLF